MEIIDLYDKHRIKLEKTHDREKKLPQDAYMLIVHVACFNHQGEMLIQKRQPFKKGWSGLWDVSAAGCALTEDSSQSAIQREMFEELGYTFDFSRMRPSLTIHFDKGFDDIYLIEVDIDIKTLKLQYEEVDIVKWASRDEILKLLSENHFIPYHASLIELMFDMNKHKGIYIDHKTNL